MTSARASGAVALRLVAAFFIEQAVGLIAIAHRFSFFIMPGVFLAQTPQLSLGESLAYGILLGVIYDVRSTLPFGVFILAFTGAAVVMKIGEGYFASDQWLPTLVLAAMALAVFYGIEGIGAYYGPKGAWLSQQYLWEEIITSSIIYVISGYLRMRRRYTR